MSLPGLRCLRRFWQDPEWRALSRWGALLVLLWLVGSALIAALAGVIAARQARPPTTAVAPVLRHPLDPLIAETATRIMPPDWDWRLLKAMVRQESGYNPRAESPGGAVGLCQLLPATARHLGLTRGQFFQPRANLAAGTRYLRTLYNRFPSVPDRAPDFLRTRLAIASYNAGPGRVRQACRAAGTTAWAGLSAHLPASTVHHVETIVDGFYPTFAAISDPQGRPSIGSFLSPPRFAPLEDDVEAVAPGP